jgi:hypothetical protein
MARRGAGLSVMLAAVLAISLGLAAAALAAPAPLSADHSSPPISSAFGSGSFGKWTVDSFGLPAYDYTIDQATNPIAAQPELNGSTDAWSQIGNDHIVADAFNHGYVQLWSQDRLYQWMNYYDASHEHYAGGFGYINVGGKVISTLYDDRPAGAGTERVFGVGYQAKQTSVPGLSESDTVYAPFGDASLLLHDVTITNTSSTTQSGSYFEYWDVNPQIQGVTQIPRGYQSPAYDASTRTLSVAQLPADEDTDPLSIFATALSGSVSAYDTDTTAFFGLGTRAAPAAVTAGHLTDSIAPPDVNGVDGDAMFAFQSPFTLAPGQRVTLRYAYGYGHPDQIQPMLAPFRSQSNPLASSEHSWSDWLPKVGLGAGYSWLSRELQWDAYTLRSAATYEECAGRHIISQGGYYQYYFGENEAFRDPLQHMLPLIWADPALARDVIAYSAEEQPPGTGAVPYGRLSLCRRFDLGTSDDLDQWLLWSASEYALATKDYAFLREQIPYAGTGGVGGSTGAGSGTLWDHLKLAFTHQEQVIGRGTHGEYLIGATGDWNDISTEFAQMTESDLVTAQAAYIYPRLAEVADKVGDPAFAAQLRAAAKRDLAVVKSQFVPRGWFARGYSGAKQIGVGSMFSEPQPWALLAGAATPAQAARVVAGYRRFLVGVGAPGGPAKIGAAIAPGSSDPGATEQEQPDINGSTEWPGGSWYAVNGWWTWALATLAGTVPHAAAYAWDEFLRNTLAIHATVFPNHWDGVISVDDECSAYYQSSPNCGIGLATGYGATKGYDTQIMHQPAYALFDLLQLAGVQATAAGYRIVPHLPMQTFNIRFPQVGVAQQPGTIRGYLRAVTTNVTMQVAPPPGVRAAQAIAYVNGSRVAAKAAGGLVQFQMPTSSNRPVDWAVTGRGKAPASCPKPSGRLSGTRLGPLALGFTRTRARRTLRRFNVMYNHMDNFCLSPGWGIRVGYPSSKLLRALPRSNRVRLARRIVFALTANRYYALHGVRPGRRLAVVARRLRLGKTFHIGLNYWYIAPGHAANGVLKVRHGIIQEVGIANQRLTSGRKAQLRFLTSFNRA